MAAETGFELPFGIKPVNPRPVDTWSGPYYGATIADARAVALTSVDSVRRFPTMEVRLIAGGQGYKYWFKDGIEDIDLVEFIGATGISGDVIPTVTNYLSTNNVAMSAITVSGSVSALGLVYSRSVVPPLPIPNITLDAQTTTTVEYLTCLRTGDPLTEQFNVGGTAFIRNSPILHVADITTEMLSSYQIFVEMVMFKKKKHRLGNYRGLSYVVSPGTPSGQKLVGIINPYGSHGGGGVNYVSDLARYNHFPVLSANQKIELGLCLNNHLIEKPVNYWSADTASLTSINLLIPTRSTGSGPNSLNNTRYGYSRNYRPLYIAFRYIAYLPENNNGRGQIISGPLSPTIRVANTLFPFKLNHYRSSELGGHFVDLSLGFLSDVRRNFTCEFY